LIFLSTSSIITNTLDIHIIDLDDVKSVNWEWDPVKYDIDLFALGQTHSKFLIINPDFIDLNLHHHIGQVVDTNRCIVWKCQDEWIAKCFTSKWTPDRGWLDYTIPNYPLIWEKNPDIDPLMTFEDTPWKNFVPPLADCRYELVWYIDPRFNPTDDQVRAFSCRPVNMEPAGVKDMGYVIPRVRIEFNPELPDMNLNVDELCPPYYELAHECAYQLDKKHTPYENIWVVKFTPAYRDPEPLLWLGIITPEFKIVYNKKIPTAVYEIDYDIPWRDFRYSHMWMLDKRHTVNLSEEIWAFKILPTGRPEGNKIVGSVSPVLNIEYNPEFPEMDYEINFTIQYHDLAYEHMWMLDKRHTVNLSQEIWAFKISAVEKPVGTTIVDYISPLISYRYNNEVEGYSFSSVKDYVIQYHDFPFKQVWMLDNEYGQGFDIWAVEACLVVDPEEYKIVSSVVPDLKLEFNPSLDLKVEIDYKIPYHDRLYEHVWYLDPKFSREERIWAAKMTAVENTQGEKDMGLITPIMPENLDVVFISYHEPNAEQNWQRVLQKAPYALRVDGVEGIFQAHKQAAKLARTDMFFVVDGDAYLTDDWEFNYQPGLFDRDCAYVWASRNPINDLVYGYGGVKLFSRKMMMRAKKWTKLDMTTTIMPKLKIMDMISNITAFNSDEFSTWRSAFREVVKLSLNIKTNPEIQENQDRLKAWCSRGSNQLHGLWAIHGALDGLKFFKDNNENFESLKKINDRAWLEDFYKKMYQ